MCTITIPRAIKDGLKVSKVFKDLLNYPRFGLGEKKLAFRKRDIYPINPGRMVGCWTGKDISVIGLPNLFEGKVTDEVGPTFWFIRSTSGGVFRL